MAFANYSCHENDPIEKIKGDVYVKLDTMGGDYFVVATTEEIYGGVPNKILANVSCSNGKTSIELTSIKRCEICQRIWGSANGNYQLETFKPGEKYSISLKLGAKTYEGEISEQIEFVLFKTGRIKLME